MRPSDVLCSTCSVVCVIGDYEPTLELSLSPEPPHMGVRRWSLENGKIWLEGDDPEKMDLRLKEFADVALHDQEAHLESIERSDKRPIVHWLSDQNSIEGSAGRHQRRHGFRIEGRMERYKHQTGTIVQLERVGYARIMEDGSLLLCHEELQDE